MANELRTARTCPDCGSALDIEDTVMGERMIPTFAARDGQDHTYLRLRPVRAVFCGGCEWVCEWSAFEAQERTK
jgi:hypothetical protein